jgi:aarF domain-containing kinase
MEGCNVTDIEQLKKMKLDRKSVAQLMTETFSEQIFLHGTKHTKQACFWFFVGVSSSVSCVGLGWIHCDPHPANVLVRRLNDTSRPQLVLLDHGLCGCCCLHRFLLPCYRCSCTVPQPSTAIFRRFLCVV